MTVEEWIHAATQRLTLAEIESARLEAQVLAAHVVGVSRSEVLAKGANEFNDLAGETLLQRREEQEPLAYIIGWREFYGRRFVVRPGVLIPRQETETLVELAISLLPPKANILDLGTGSGCIGITIALERPAARVTLSDISEVALDVASQNALDLGASVEIAQSDGLASFEGQRFDAIVSNPPYISRSESLPREVSEYEPHEALYADEHGFAFYELLASEGSAFAKNVVVEVGYAQALAVKSLFADQGWSLIEARNDLLGHERALAFASQ